MDISVLVQRNDNMHLTVIGFVFSFLDNLPKRRRSDLTTRMSPESGKGLSGVCSIFGVCSWGIQSKKCIFRTAFYLGCTAFRENFTTCLFSGGSRRHTVFDAFGGNQSNLCMFGHYRFLLSLGKDGGCFQRLVQSLFIFVDGKNIATDLKSQLGNECELWRDLQRNFQLISIKKF